MYAMVKTTLTFSVLNKVLMVLLIIIKLNIHVPGFLKLLCFMGCYVSVCMCPPLRALIISGMIWCDKDHL